MNTFRNVVAGLALTSVLPLGAQTCVDRQATGGKVYVGVQQSNPLGSLLFMCAPQLASTVYTGPVSYADGVFDVTTQLRAGAWADAFGLHAFASSVPTPNAHDGLDPLGAFPGFALAAASSVLEFTLIAPTAAPPATRSPVTFEVFGSGTMRGTPGYFAGNTAYDISFQSNGTGFTDTGYYRDSTGAFDTGNYLHQLVSGPERGVQFGIDFTGKFLAGSNGFTLRLDLLAIGDAASDFSHTATVAGLRVAPGYSLTLPAGLYTADPADASHYILTSLLPVPEPGTAALFLPGLALLIGLMRRRASR